MQKLQDKTFLASSQYESANKVQARWNLYEQTVPKVDLHQKGLAALSLKGQEDILDVGCGDGRMLKDLYLQGHKGRLVGVDISRGIFQPTEGVDFVEASADALPFPDNSFDVILSFFMLYHMPEKSSQ